MGTDNDDIASKSGHLDFFDSDEYDMVSSQDVLLMSEKEVQSEESNAFDNLVYKHMFSSFKQYQEEWDELYNKKELDIEKLKKKSMDGQLRSCRFRSVWWRCLLGIFHEQPKQWVCQLKIHRKHYDEICRELEQNPWNIKENKPFDNPLSQESDSIWQKYFSDEELKTVVYQDVERTFPGMDFFRKTYIQQIMVRILFCYARLNPTLCYRQGMHEILAPIVFVLHCDQQAFLHAKEQTLKLDEDMCKILNPEYLEQDAYSIFKYVMNHIESSYRLNNVMTNSTGNFPADVLFESKTCQNEIMLRLDFIKKSILHPRDPELSEHLQKLDIPFHLFGIRWLRLLFGREFLLQDLLVLWDFIFSNNFETVNFIVVAMLVAIRQILLNGDYTTCLCNLMKYPSGVDVSFIVNYALHLKDSEKFPCPDNSKILRFYQSQNVINKSCKESADFQPLLRVKRGPKQFVWLSEKPYLLLLGESGNGDKSIVPGYAADDSNLIKVELEQMRTILNLVCHKLTEFHSALTANLLNNSCCEVQAALEGIFELSCLLQGYIKESNSEIETACEAGEVRDSVTQTSHLNMISKINKLKPYKGSINVEKKSHTLPKIKRNLKSGELKVFKLHEGGTIKGVPMIDPLHLIKNLCQDECLNCKCE